MAGRDGTYPFATMAVQGLDSQQHLRSSVPKLRFRWRGSAVLFIALAAGLGLAPARAQDAPVASASSADDAFPAAGAIDGDRFALRPGSSWHGSAQAGPWWWQVQFPRPREVGAIVQVVGDHEFVFRNAPRRYVWQGSVDGMTWQDWPETFATEERRLFRVHRLHAIQRVRYARLRIESATGERPVLREVEFLADPKGAVSFPAWLLVVNTTHDSALPGHGREFIPLARSCAGWEQAPAQQVWLDSFDEAFVAAEPRPLCAFLSGNFKDWCEVDRRWWRGTQDVLRRQTLPLWASCGGAQGLALLSEYGVDQPWDCPHCRDPHAPKTPLYTHLGHTGVRPCGDYSACVFERGPHWIRQVGQDPVFRGLPDEMQVMESHCGQIAWPPRGWSLVATAGPDTETRMQCLRLGTNLIYAAQFHIEMAGTPEVSRRIMGNFLALARESAPSDELVPRTLTLPGRR